jgi:hypothetical protein
MVNNKCGKCGKTVYAAEEKKFEHPKEGLKFFHGLCFATYKKEYEKACQDEKNREYVVPTPTISFYNLFLSN